MEGKKEGRKRREEGREGERKEGNLGLFPYKQF
jgi:hypothetical protein